MQDIQKLPLPTRRKPALGWFHRYPARFSAAVLSRMFKGVERRLGKPPNRVLDPFCGTGATLAYARQLGIRSDGVELTALGALISTVRLEPPDLNKAFMAAERLTSNLGIPRTHQISDELVCWIGEQNARFLNHLLLMVSRIRDKRIRNWLQLAISSSLRPSSVWLSGSIKPQIDPHRDVSDLRQHFLRAVRALKRDCSLESAEKSVQAKVYTTDTRNLPFWKATFDAVITSPPYWTMYDYFDVHRLSYLAFGWKKNEKAQVGQMSEIERDGIGFIPPFGMRTWYEDEFGGETFGNGRSLRKYFNDMEQHLTEALRVLKPGGVAAYAVANSFRRGRKFRLATAVADLMMRVGFIEVDPRKRMNSHRRILPASRDFSTGRFKTGDMAFEVEEYIIYARKRR